MSTMETSPAAVEVQFRQQILRLLDQLVAPPRMLTATEARAQFFRLLDEVSEGPPVVIHRPKHDQSVMLVRQAVFFSLVRQLVEQMRNEQMHLVGT